MNTISITGVAVSALFICFILSKKKRARADYLLIIINLLTIGFLVLDMVIRARLTTLLFFLQTISPYFLSGFYLFFALDTLQEKIHQNGRSVLIFIPAIVSALYFGIELFILNHYNDAELRQLYERPPLIYHLFYKGNQIYSLICLIWLTTRIKMYRRGIRNTYSFIEPIQLTWLWNSTWLYAGLVTVALVTFLTSNFNLLPINISAAYLVVNGCLVLCIYYISFHGIRQYSLVGYNHVVTHEIATSSTKEEKNELSAAKYKTSSLSSAEQQTIYQNLLDFLDKKKPYLEPKLQLQEVAAGLNVSTHNLSQTINSVYGKPFYDLINGYRVLHLQKLLQDPAKRKFTILGLGLESGFNSKASLNRVFKDETGLSPKEYQQRHLPK